MAWKLESGGVSMFPQNYAQGGVYSKLSACDRCVVVWVKGGEGENGVRPGGKDEVSSQVDNGKGVTIWLALACLVVVV